MSTDAEILTEVARHPAVTTATLEREPVIVADRSRLLFELARRVAVTDCTVLLSGESGTGKEVLARYIHARSPRAARPLVAVNCAAIPENMLEALLFGYERGAFTGAATAHAGKFEQAQGGSLLLDEITEMPLGLQAKLLRVLQEREVERIGGRVPLKLDVRVIATTNRNLRTEVLAGRFREDLYFRLCVFPLGIPPLRDRREDVLPLAMQLLASRCPPGGRIPALSAEAGQLLLTYSWPGNVRELDNLLQRALILCTGSVIEAGHIRFESITDFGQSSAAMLAAMPAAVSTPMAADGVLRAKITGDSAALAAATGRREAAIAAFKSARPATAPPPPRPNLPRPTPTGAIPDSPARRSLAALVDVARALDAPWPATLAPLLDPLRAVIAESGDLMDPPLLRVARLCEQHLPAPRLFLDDPPLGRLILATLRAMLLIGHEPGAAATAADLAGQVEHLTRNRMVGAA